MPVRKWLNLTNMKKMKKFIWKYLKTPQKSSRRDFSQWIPILSHQLSAFYLKLAHECELKGLCWKQIAYCLLSLLPTLSSMISDIYLFIAHGSQVVGHLIVNTLCVVLFVVKFFINFLFNAIHLILCSICQSLLTSSIIESSDSVWNLFPCSIY